MAGRRNSFALLIDGVYGDLCIVSYPNSSARPGLCLCLFVFHYPIPFLSRGWVLCSSASSYGFLGLSSLGGHGPRGAHVPDHSDVRAARLLEIFGNVRNLPRGIVVASCTLLCLFFLVSWVTRV